MSVLTSSDLELSGYVITDLTICIGSVDESCFNPAPRSAKWHFIAKDLYLHTAKQTAWLYVKHSKETELRSDDLVIIDIRVGGALADLEPGIAWESRPCGIWLARDKYKSDHHQVVTQIDVLFGVDAVDPRPRWCLMDQALHLEAQMEIAAARLTVLHGKAKLRTSDPDTVLRSREDGKFRILQISDTHMVTGVGTCKDAIDADKHFLPESEADPLTVYFMSKVLDIERPDLVILTGDQLHHDIPDSQSALFKVVAPLIERSIPWAAVFGNHDSEGTYALSRSIREGGKEQMTLLRSLPHSLCEYGPEDVDGVGNYYLQVLASAPSLQVLATLYLLDSHGQISSEAHNPDYEPIQRSQIDWFRHTSQTLRREREQVQLSNVHLSLAFLHIPIPEYGDHRLATRAGQRREPTEGPSINSHFYDALVEEGVSALGCGHDHVNDFCALLPPESRSWSPDSNNGSPRQGPWLCYSGSAGFGGYCSYGGKRFHRRARVWEIDTNIRGIKTWKRVEYDDKRVDELVLVEGGSIVIDPDGATHE